MRLSGELEILWEMGRKAEIQQVVEERERVFLAQQFLPRKIAELSWSLGNCKSPHQTSNTPQRSWFLCWSSDL